MLNWPLQWVDTCMVGLLCFCFLSGAWRGLVHEVFALAAWVVAFFVANAFAATAAQHLPVSGFGDSGRYAIGFGLLFLAAMCVTSLTGSVLTRLLKLVGLGWANRFLGAWFGLARGALLLLVMAAVIQITSLHATQGWQASQGAVWLGQGLRTLQPWLPAQMGRFF